MSRQFTQQEFEEYNKRRRKNLEETAAKLGMTPEQLEAVEQRARGELSSRCKAGKTETEEALHVAISLLENGYDKKLTGTEDNCDAMDVGQFGRFLAAHLCLLDEEERREASKVIARKIACWRGGEDESISLREEILLELQAMTKRHNYYAGKS